MAPEAPLVGLGALFLGRRRNRHHLIDARIQRTRDAADAAALAGRVVALEYRDHGHFLEAGVARQQGELALVFLQFFLVFLLFYFLREIQCFKDMQLINRRQQGRRIDSCRWLFGRIETLADRFLDHFADGQAAVARVFAFDNEPRRLGGAGMADHALVHGAEFVVEFEMLPVTIGHAPARLGVFFQHLETFFLLVPGQMQPELDDQGAFVGEHFLQQFGSLQALVEIGGLGDAVHAIEDRPGVPGAEKHADFSLGRQGAPETPHHRPVEFFIGWLAHAMGLHVTRVHPLVEQVHCFPATRAIYPAEQDNDRKLAALCQVELGIQQRFAQQRYLLVICRLVDLVTQFRRFEHAYPPR
jgi:hypothetical protein